MAIDPYAFCPCGSGKKIKFCCSDLVHELDKIHRMLEGDQRAACLDYIESLETKFPDRASLLSIKAMLQAQLGLETKAEATLAHFREKFPGNPVALAETATLIAAKDGGVAGISTLQDALDKCGDQIAAQVYDAIGLIAEALLAENQLIAARGHLALQLAMTDKDRRPLELLVRLNSSPQVPMLSKEDLRLMPAPDDALWKNSMNEALAPAMRGAWRTARQNLNDLTVKVGNWPTIWHNIAVLSAWLADSKGAVEAFRKFATLQVPLDDAVEAEALAQFLDTASADQVEVLTVPYAVTDTEALLARLLASPRAVRMPVDLARMGTETEPPPKGAFWLLDRDALANGAEITREAVPRVVGQVFLFGKQTDRAARLELVVFRTEIAAGQEAAKAVGGDLLGAAGPEEVTTHIPAVQHALSWNWRLPDDLSPDKRLELMCEQRRDLILHRWTEMPQALLDGKSASQAAADPALRIKLLAAILLLELSTDQVTSDFDFNELRRQLGLPEQTPIDPATVHPAELPLARMAHIDAKRLSDEDLLELYRRADHFRNIAALRVLAHEVIARPALDGKLDKAEVYGILAQIEPDTSKAIGYLDQARAAAEAAKTSTAPWDLAELAMRIARDDVAEADRLLQHLRNEHMREPGVAQALYQILSEAGIIGPDGKPSAAVAAAGREGPGLVVPGAAAPAEAGKIWTPGSDQPTGKKSALWTPGME